MPHGTSRAPQRRASRALQPLLAILLLGTVSCAAPPATGPRAVITTAAGERSFRIEIVETDELRARGLMGRERIDEDAGMAFLWSEDTDSAFHMRDTLIPLTVAFFAADGRILATIDMVPCTADHCPRYDPGGRYRGALEVKAGALERAGVRQGDRLRIVR